MTVVPTGFRVGARWSPRFQVLDPEDDTTVITAAQLGSAPLVYFVRPDGQHVAAPTAATPDTEVEDAWRASIIGTSEGTWTVVARSPEPYEDVELATAYFSPVP